MAMELFQIFGRIALNGVEDVNNDLNETTQNAHASSNKMVSAFKKIGAAIGAAAFLLIHYLLQRRKRSDKSKTEQNKN